MSGRLEDPLDVESGFVAVVRESLSEIVVIRIVYEISENVHEPLLDVVDLL